MLPFCSNYLPILYSASPYLANDIFTLLMFSSIVQGIECEDEVGKTWVGSESKPGNEVNSMKNVFLALSQ